MFNNNQFLKQQEFSKQQLTKLIKFLQKGTEFELNPPSSLMNKLQDALNRTDERSLRVALIGGFSEGKTSIASAWLGRLEQDMNISQQESSNAIKIYRIKDSKIDIELIDTPGLFGFKEQKNKEGDIEKYKETTKKYISEAHLILYVMNSINPIKDSHSDDLNWLFRELNLLPRTIFVLSRFDEVADITDKWDYDKNLKVKQENIKSRLKTMIQLTDDEERLMNIVGVSANPFGNGAKYWLENQDEFREISHISDLKKATNKVLEKNNLIEIILQTEKTIIKDVLIKQMPILREKRDNLSNKLDEFVSSIKILKKELDPMASKIPHIQTVLSEYVDNYFKDLIMQLRGTDLLTFKNFYDDELGEDGEELINNIQKEFRRQCLPVSKNLESIEISFNAEIDKSEQSAGYTLLSQGVGLLSKQPVSGSSIIAARDGIVSVGKMVGLDFAKFLKFKPWGAANLATKLNVVFAVGGLVMEAWDSYQKQKEEENLEKVKKEIAENLRENKKELIKFVLSENFVSNSFPEYNNLKQKFDKIQEMNEEYRNKTQRFEEWYKEGEIIEGEYTVIE